MVGIVLSRAGITVASATTFVGKTVAIKVVFEGIVAVNIEAVFDGSP